MLFFLVKNFVYLLIFIFTMYGMMTFSNSLKKEEKVTLSQKLDDNDASDDDDELPTVSVVRDSIDKTSVSLKSSSIALPEKMIHELSHKIDTNFNDLKNSFNKQMENTKQTIESSIKEMIVSEGPVKEKVPSSGKASNKIPTVRSFEKEESASNELSDEEEGSDLASDDEDSDEDISESFQDASTYDGVTSPYCLNCFAI
jgi:hypothetical protein